MKPVTEETTTAWLSGDYTGQRRPMVRATIGRMHMDRTPYKIGFNTSTDWRHRGNLNSALFNQHGQVRELKNIQSIKWTRGVDTDVATCTLVLYNVQWKKSQTNPNPEEFDFPGWFTPNRGDDNRWDYEGNAWRDWLLPDRIIRTFEGYGLNNDESPEDDPNMYPSGVWLIDDINFGVNGLITVECRDVGRLLLDQIMYPPVVPWTAYPLWWDKRKMIPRPDHYVPTGAWQHMDHNGDSNELYVGDDYMDGTTEAISSDGTVFKHKGKHAFDDNPKTYWLSVGSEDRLPVEYIEGSMDSTDVSGIKLNLRGGPYTVYVSLYDSVRDKWLGHRKIPFEQKDDQAPIAADLPWIKKIWFQTGDGGTFEMDRVYSDITRIRLTLVSRWESGIGQLRTYRAAVREFAYCTEVEKVDGEGKIPQGNYDDYTDIVKWLLGWAGFYWPRNSTVRRILAEEVTLEPTADDSVLPRGRIWGDFEKTGTTGIIKLDPSVWDKKPLMDGINTIREIVGFDFWVDETGGAVWRLPNVFKKGNYLAPHKDGHGTPGRTSTVLEIDERTTLIEMSTKLSSRNVRERIFVADAAGNYGAVVIGYNPAPTGMRRVGGWTDSHFRSKRESRRMADLIAIRQSYLYRENTLTIAANPAIQIDDQVVIFERMTGESYLHRITGISSEFDFENGRWTYQLTTNWLGDEAFTSQAWRPQIHPSTEAYLRELGRI